MRLCYSYIRFSTPEQKKGDSLRRQLSRTEQFAKENGLWLDDTLKLRDEGKSAYKGRHRQGALGRFLKAIEDGDVPDGSVLVVESLDRLSREEIDEALELFMGIIRRGVEIVTLIDNQWYSKKSIRSNPASLFLSIAALWRAHDESRTKSDRLSRMWEQKRKEAAATGVPMSRICPAWLKLSKDKQSFEVIPERAQKVRLIYWLTLRGWGKQRISKLFNQAKLPTWGVGKKRARAWHYSYVQKILDNPAVIGLYVPHTVRSGTREPLGEEWGSYYPAVVDPDVYLRVQNRVPGPRGRPSAKRIGNLYRGLLYDGEHPDHAMWYKDHGGKENWKYVVSDHRRVAPNEPLFSWNYPKLEALILNYLSDLDWPGLLANRNGEQRKLDKALSVAEAKLKQANTEAKRLVKLAGQLKGDNAELAEELERLDEQRAKSRSEIRRLTQDLAKLKNFDAGDMQELLQEMAADNTRYETRQRLQFALRQQVQRIELYRELPKRLLDGVKLPKSGMLQLEQLLKGRCVRLQFVNSLERWIVEDPKSGRVPVQLRGELPENGSLELVRDEFGGKELRDKSGADPRLPPIKRREYERAQKAKTKAARPAKAKRSTKKKSTRYKKKVAQSKKRARGQSKR